MASPRLLLQKLLRQPPLLSLRQLYSLSVPYSAPEPLPPFPIPTFAPQSPPIPGPILRGPGGAIFYPSFPHIGMFAAVEGEACVGEEGEGLVEVWADSVKRKRKRKMNKHKYKKRRKLMRKKT